MSRSHAHKICPFWAHLPICGHWAAPPTERESHLVCALSPRPCFRSLWVCVPQWHCRVTVLERHWAPPSLHGSCPSDCKNVLRRPRDLWPTKCPTQRVDTLGPIDTHAPQPPGPTSLALRTCSSWGATPVPCSVSSSDCLSRCPSNVPA